MPEHTTEPATIYPDETVLADDYPVFGDYLYVCDGKVIRSDVFGNVARLKADLRNHHKLPAVEIRRCNIAARQKAEAAPAEEQDAERFDGRDPNDQSWR